MAGEEREDGRQGSIVAILCDAGERYAHSYYDPAWYAARAIDITVQGHLAAIRVARAAACSSPPR